MPDNIPYIDFSRIKFLLTDSRNLRDPESTLFFALDGNGRSGEDFIDELYHKGVRHFVVKSGYESQLDATFIKCKQPLQLLQQFAKQHRLNYNGKVIAITGSNGKTVVKEWLFKILSKHQYSYRSPKSYNSQIGVPLSLWEIPLQSKLAIIEAGISMPEEMYKLSDIIQPEIGIFTNIGNAHQENFLSLEGKTIEKLNLFVDCKTIIYRKDQSISALLIEKHFSDRQLIAWSLQDANAPFYFKINKVSHQLTLFENGKELHTYSFPFSDLASIENISHSIVAAITMGIAPQNIDVSNMEAIAMRLEQKQGIQGCSLINDAYNSDVLSLGIGLDSLTKLAKSKHLKTTVFLSDMEQSGIESDDLYPQIAELLKTKKINRLIGIGKNLTQQQEKFALPQQEFYTDTDDFLDKFSSENYQKEAILFKGARSFKFERIIRLLEKRRHQTIMEIDLNALRENFTYFRNLLLPQTKIMGMVKAFAYGSGSIEIARTLQQQGCNYLAVAVADEGVELRNSGITLPIVVMTPERNSFEVMIQYHLEPAIYSFSELQAFTSVALETRVENYPIHIKFDTGMHRLGFTEKDIDILCETLTSNKALKPVSVFSHLSAADEEIWDSFTHKQISLFEKIARQIEANLGHTITKHILNSAGTERFTNHQNDMIRLGIGMYGISSTNRKMQPIATLKTAITQIRQLSKEETVGYGRKGVLKQDSRIATIPIGYADGIWRALGNGNGYVLINGQKAPYIGNICMDLSMVDVTNIEAKEGDEVILMGEGITAQIIAKQLNTIPYEVLTSISQRVKRVYVE